MQSFKSKEMEEPLNGDGFGIGWYEQDLEHEPAIFTSVSPAWNNRNLKHLAPKINSNCMFAQLRAATVVEVTEINCHPFQDRKFLMMHNNDGIKQFDEIKRPLLNKLSNERFKCLSSSNKCKTIK